MYIPFICNCKSTLKYQILKFLCFIKILTSLCMSGYRYVGNLFPSRLEPCTSKRTKQQSKYQRKVLTQHGWQQFAQMGFSDGKKSKQFGQKEARKEKVLRQQVNSHTNLAKYLSVTSNVVGQVVNLDQSINQSD